MAKNINYFDDDGNYVNIENLSLAEIYRRGSEEGYKRGYIDACIKNGFTNNKENNNGSV